MSSKGFMAVWQPGDGALWWRTGMSIDEFESRDDTYFKKGFRLVSVDIYKWSDIPKKYSYTAVWRKGTGAQRWWVGSGASKFKAQDADFGNQGLRITALDIQDGKFVGVWRAGSGVQWWRSGMSIDELKDQDATYFQQGLRLVALKKHGSDEFAAVWRPGTGG